MAPRFAGLVDSIGWRWDFVCKHFAIRFVGK
jgi:hypothetical protein